jgi:hypothetical protein
MEVKESQNASGFLPIELDLVIFDLDLFAVVGGHVCAGVKFVP